MMPLDRKKTYPVCIGRQWAGPSKDCGRPMAFLERRERVPWEIEEPLTRIVEDARTGDLEAARERVEDILPLREGLMLDKFDRRKVNRRLKQYAAGDEQWRDE